MADQEMELTKVSVETKLRFLLDAAHITKNIEPVQALELIKDIDDQVGIWALTVLLARHFDRELLLAAEHAPELLGMTDEELLSEINLIEELDGSEPAPEEKVEL